MPTSTLSQSANPKRPVAQARRSPSTSGMPSTRDWFGDASITWACDATCALCPVREMTIELASVLRRGDPLLYEPGEIPVRVRSVDGASCLDDGAGGTVAVVRTHRRLERDDLDVRDRRDAHDSRRVTSVAPRSRQHTRACDDST